MIGKTNKNCVYYNWGGVVDLWPFYPKEYGARCEYYDKFFSEIDHKLDPNCSECNIGDKYVKEKSKS